jgi:hypothetical protein
MKMVAEFHVKDTTNPADTHHAFAPCCGPHFFMDGQEVEQQRFVDALIGAGDVRGAACVAALRQTVCDDWKAHGRACQPVQAVDRAA